jgi:hypothetical protein
MAVAGFIGARKAKINDGGKQVCCAQAGQRPFPPVKTNVGDGVNGVDTGGGAV